MRRALLLQKEPLVKIITTIPEFIEANKIHLDRIQAYNEAIWEDIRNNRIQIKKQTWLNYVP